MSIENMERLLDGLTNMLREWKLSSGALSALSGRHIVEGMEALAAEQLLVEVAAIREEVRGATVEDFVREIADTLEERAARRAVPQGRRR